MIPNKNLIILVLVFVFLWTISPKNKNERHDVEINALAFSHHIYTTSSVCPNSSGLAEIKQAYLKTIHENDVENRKWVEENFNKVFNEACSKIEYKQGD